MALTAAQIRMRITDLDVDQVLDDLADAAARDAYLDKLAVGAEQTLAGYAAGRYSTPLTATEQTMALETRLVRLELMRRKTWNFTDAIELDQEALVGKNGLLVQISKRVLHLMNQTSARSADEQGSMRATTPSARTTGRAKKLNREQTKGF